LLEDNVTAHKTLTIRNATAEFLIFTTQKGENSIHVRVEDSVVRKIRTTAEDGKIITLATIAKDDITTFCRNQQD
jgi:hypothetical protein